MHILGSLISFSTAATWILLPLNAIFLLLDSIVYSLVAYAFELFLRLAQMNFNTIAILIEPLIDRVEALIMVLILFKLGMSLIQYLLNPESFSGTTGGGKLVTRIVVIAALLVSYKFIFGLLNEFSMLVIGYRSDYSLNLSGVEGAEGGNELFPILSSLGITVDESDMGLLARLVFGSQETDLESFGNTLAGQTLNLFIYDKFEGQETPAKNAIARGVENDNFFSIFSVIDDINVTVEYKWPLLSTAMGLFLIWSLVRVAIEIGIRTFKIIVLQIMAPVAIISYLDDASYQKVGQNYIKAYQSTYVDAFIRIASVYLIVGIISAFWVNVESIFNTGDGLTGKLLLIVILFAGFKFIQELPKFLSSFLGFNVSETSKSSFGAFLGGVAGGVVGGSIGLATGISTGRRMGAGGFGTAANALTGALSGASSGIRGKTISEKMKGISESNAKNKERALHYSRMGGFWPAVGSSIEQGLGIPQRAEDRASKFEDNNKLIAAVEAARGEAIKDHTYKTFGSGKTATKLKYGNNADEFAQKYAERDSRYLGAKAKYESLMESGGNGKDILAAKIKMDSVIQEGKNIWNTHADDVGEKDAKVKTAIQRYKDTAYSGSEKQRSKGKGVDINSHDLTTAKGIKEAKKANRKAAKEIRKTGAVERANRAKGYDNEK